MTNLQVTLFGLSHTLSNVEALKIQQREGKRLVIDYDNAKEQEASSAFTSTHNVYTRVPAAKKERLSFVKKTAELLGPSHPDVVLMCFDNGLGPLQAAQIEFNKKLE